MLGQPGRILYRRTAAEILRKTKSLVDACRITREQAEDELEEGTLHPSTPSYLQNVPDLDLIELLW